MRIIVDARAEALSPSARPRRSRNRRGLDMGHRARRAAIQKKKASLRDRYREAGAEGRAFNPLFKELGGAKREVFPAWQEGKKTKRGKS